MVTELWNETQSITAYDHLTKFDFFIFAIFWNSIFNGSRYDHMASMHSDALSQGAYLRQNDHAFFALN